MQNNNYLLPHSLSEPSKQSQIAPQGQGNKNAF